MKIFSYSISLYQKLRIIVFLPIGIAYPALGSLRKGSFSILAISMANTPKSSMTVPQTR
jgi:hypothetical protein